MNEQEILLPIVGIHLFLGIALIFISILLFVFLRKPQIYLVITSLLLLTFSHFYYYLYYTGSLVHFPNIIFIFPIFIVLGHIALFHSFLDLLKIRTFWNYKTLFHLPIIFIQFWTIFPKLMLDNNSKIQLYLNQKNILIPEAIAGKSAEIFFFIIAIINISLTNYILIYRFFPNFLPWNKTINKFHSEDEIHITKIKCIIYFNYIVLILAFTAWMLIPSKIFHASIPLAFSISIPIFLIGLIFFPYILQLGTQIKVHEKFSLPKYGKSNLQNLDLVALEEKIAPLLDQKIYLQEGINLPKFAKECGISVQQMSAYFNIIKRIKYADFIRKFRIVEAKHLLAQKLTWKTTRIGFESGFNSTSSFFEAFKLETDMSPSEFRKKLKA